MIDLPLQADDDPGFIEALREVVPARELVLVKIDHWFGSRWLHFSGKLMGALGFRSRRVTVPPFHPHRVVFEWPLQRPRLHPRQTSAANHRRFLDELRPGATVLWYSGDTLAMGRGSAMIYGPGGDDVYEGFKRDAGTWSVVERLTPLARSAAP